MDQTNIKTDLYENFNLVLKHHLFIIFFILLKNLTATQNKSSEQIATAYTVFKDFEYATDNLQTMDIYLATDEKHLGKDNYTIIFLHGGSYYFSDKSEEERYI